MGQEMILELKEIYKSFGAVKALKGVSFSLRKGTVHAIVGENGAGKSTLMKVLSGMYQPDNGEIWLEGRRVTIANETEGINLGISMIYQELNSVLDMTVMDNIFLGQEITRYGLTNKRAMYKRTEEVMDALGLDIRPNTEMRTLSVANRQMVEIAKAISRDAKILVMDEPTASISEKEVDRLFQLIQKMKGEGLSVIYISHRLEELPALADDLTIIRDGETVHRCKMNNITPGEMIHYMVGRELNSLFPKVDVPIGKERLRLDNFGREKSFYNINLSVHAGEILGISGLVGAGRTEVMRAVFGLDRPDYGKIFLDGKEIHIKNVQQAIKAGIAMISEDRRRFGLVTIRSIWENVMYAHMNSFTNKIGLLKKSEEEKKIREQVEFLKLKTSGLQMPVTSLSGGNQQKVVIAKWLISPPKVLIMDEPTKGIDVGAKYEIYKLMCALAKEGMAIIMISSELPEILGMSDRVLVMRDGRIRGEFNREEATQENIMALSAGGKNE